MNTVVDVLIATFNGVAFLVFNQIVIDWKSYMIDTDPADDDTPHLITETPDGITKTVPLRVAYWLDLINKKQPKK